MPRERGPQSDLEFTAGCGLPVYPKFVEFASAARRWIAAQMNLDPAELRFDQSIAPDADTFDLVELVVVAQEELNYPFNEHDLELVSSEPMLEGDTVGAFINRLFHRR